jgi:XRE family aerobic/anaerobic benzoate catabolism transcriptional regulator
MQYNTCHASGSPISVKAKSQTGRLGSTSAQENGRGATYLRRLGERVREGRARRAVTRKMLAQQSGVSERYLAQLESGRGNISVLLLREIARALRLEPGSLLQQGPGPAPELQQATELLRRLSPEGLREARQLLLDRFAAAEIAVRRQRVALIGLRGAGKSTLGAALAGSMGVPFLELDRLIEQSSGLGLSAIFDLYGQDGFRRFERRCLEEVLSQHPRFVLATGGSIVSEPASFERLLSTCFTVWLRATPEEHMQRVLAQGDTRPMADNKEAMADLRRILAVREPLYAMADAILDTRRQSRGQSAAALEQVVRPNGRI